MAFSQLREKAHLLHQTLTTRFPTTESPLRLSQAIRERLKAHTDARENSHAPPKKAGPRTAATIRGPNSNTSERHISHNLWHAQADSFACATLCDDFATASAVGIPAFLIRLTPALARDRAPQLRSISG